MQQKLFTHMQARVREAARRSGRSPDSVRIVAVSKGQEVEKISQLAAAGARDFGENYVQEWRSKVQRIALTEPVLASEIRWHFIGHLQSNKAKEVVGRVELLHSLDSLKLAQKVSELARAQSCRQRVCLEVNLAAEPDKSGLLPETLLRDLSRFAELPDLVLEGLMAVPPAFADPEQVRPYFAQLKSLLDECNRSGVLQRPLQELSMGMSHDFEVAIEEGATLVRIGTALFGPRK